MGHDARIQPNTSEVNARRTAATVATFIMNLSGKKPSRETQV